MEQWKEAIRWFFRAAKGRGEDTTPQEQPVWVPPEAQSGWSEWKVAFLTILRRRKYSYRTEQSYLVWIERFARHLGIEDLRAQGEEQISEFLDSLALNEQLSASSQRQALNALVFLYRDVFGRELGDFSDYRRARVRPHLPVWLTRVLIGQPPSQEFGCPIGWNGSIPMPARSGPGFGYEVRDEVCDEGPWMRSRKPALPTAKPSVQHGSRLNCSCAIHSTPRAASRFPVSTNCRHGAKDLPGKD